MGAFDTEKKFRDETVSRFWSGEFDGDSITGTVVSAKMVPNTFKDNETVPELVISTENGEVTVTGTRAVLRNLIFDLNPDAGDSITLTRTGTKPSTKIGYKPAVLYTGEKNGAAPAPHAVSEKKPF